LQSADLQIFYSSSQVSERQYESSKETRIEAANDSEETPAAENVNKKGKVQQVRLALDRCHNQCEDAGLQRFRQVECGEIIKELKNSWG